MYYFRNRGYFMPVFKSKSKTARPAAMIVLSFAIVIAIGSLLLMLPVSSKNGSFTNPVSAVFTATSATCVTGLSVVDTGTYWSIFGQIVILLMIQIGGLGFVTLVSFFNFLLRKKMELHSIQMASESVNTSGFFRCEAFGKVCYKSFIHLRICRLAAAYDLPCA